MGKDNSKIDLVLVELEEAVEIARKDRQLAYDIGIDCCEDSSEEELKLAKRNLDDYRNNGGKRLI